MVRLLVLLLFVPFLSGAPGAPRQQQAGPELIAATCSLSSVAAHSLVTTPALKRQRLSAVNGPDSQPSSWCVFSPLTLQTFSLWTLL